MPPVLLQNITAITRFTDFRQHPKLPNGASVKQLSKSSLSRPACALFLITVLSLPTARSQEPPPAATQAPKPADAAKLELPAQIEFLETRVRFESNGDSYKEVHTRVHINNELGARQFARLSFDYNRSFQQIDFPLVRITHANGGVVDILPSAISDQPNPAVVNAPAYQDVRVKSLRILGLEPNDILEYRMITINSSPPFAPRFYLSHDAARGGLVSEELFEIDLPADLEVAPVTSGFAATYATEKSANGANARVLYRWKWSGDSSNHEDPAMTGSDPSGTPTPFDIVISNLDWTDLVRPLRDSLAKFRTTSRVGEKAHDLIRKASTPEDKLKILYDFVSQKVRTIDLPMGSTGFRLRDPADVLSSGYGIPEDKSILLSMMASSVGMEACPAEVLSKANELAHGANPSALSSVLNVARMVKGAVWLDPSVEVAPFGMVRPEFRGKPTLLVCPPNHVQLFEKVSSTLPFAATQRVTVDAAINADGLLSAKVSYRMRGDNEMLLRVAFNQSAKDKWNEVAQLLALSDGFRGKITNVTASDPYATKSPFTVEYQITQPKFVDWSKKPVRIPALLPLLGLPDPPATHASGSALSPIDLGTPLDVETHLTLHLPTGTTVRTPTGTSVVRDYATFASRYQVNTTNVTASRHLTFLSRHIPSDRAADYNAFTHAVQSDEAQQFLLDRSTPPAPSKPPAQ